MSRMKKLSAALLGASTVISSAANAGIRVRQLRSKRSSQWVGPMRMGRSKSKLVPETYGPSRYLCRRWNLAML